MHAFSSTTSRSVVAVAFLAVALAGCKTGDTGGGPQLSPSAEYSIFWDQGDHLEELVEAKKFDEADKLFGEQGAFFSEKFEKYRASLERVSTHLNGRHAPSIERATAAVGAAAWPALQDDWSKIRLALTDAEKTIGVYDAHPLLRDGRFRSPGAAALKDRTAALKARILADAQGAFASFDHFGPQAFFAAFPIDLDARATLSSGFDALRPRLVTATRSDLRRFAGHYPANVLPPGAQAELGNQFVAAALREDKGARRNEIGGIVAAVKEARNAGFEPKALPGVKFGFIEVTSRSLLKKGQIEFPAAVDVDLPVDVAKAELDKALSNPLADTADYLVVFDVALAKTQRRISTKSALPSRFVAGYRTQPNPAYNNAQNELNQAQIELQQAAMSAMSADSQYCYGFGCLAKAAAQIAAGAARQQAQERVERAMATVSSTPMTVEVPVYKSYRYDRAKVNASKTMTVHYYVIDRKKQRYFKSTFDVAEKKTFEVAYSVHAEDPERTRIISSADTDENVASWEEAPASVKLSQLVSHYVKNSARSQALPPLATLRQTMLDDKNVALRKYEATRYDSRPLKDPRFDSVVVVYSKSKNGASLGSGFFVAPDVVLTNFHVIDGATFVEMKTYDGQETFGKVIAQDLIRDLAVVKVQSRGRPVKFYTDRTIDPGETVEAIGHPRGLEFSITRGIVSAVRRSNTVVLEKGAGREILFVQTDSPINPGNSGGPLFLGDKVIGVNTQARTASEGLNFSVHYSEVLAFLRENLDGF